MIFRRHRHLKIIRYVFAGVVVSVGYTFTVVLLVSRVGWTSPALASAASFALWTPVSYIVHRDFTFLYVISGRHLATMVKFGISFIFRLVAAGYTVHLLSGVFGSPYLVGVLANWLVLPAISYLLMDMWIFRMPPGTLRGTVRADNTSAKG
jgi:putative flippase GtrA